MGSMDAQLVGAAGIWLHLQPGQRLRRLLDDAIVRHGMVGALLAMLGDAHAVTVRSCLLDQPGRDLVLALRRHALDQGPIGFLGLTRPECLRQLHRSKAGAGNDQHA